MKVVKNFLSRDLITEIKKYIQNADKNKSWYSNSSWDTNIVKNSGLVTILPIQNFSNELMDQFILYDEKYKNYNFTFQYYKWHRGSYIPWHDDGNYKIGATIYLSKEWDVEDGGIFFYSETNNVEDLKCIYPQYNTLVINERHEFHHVSLINYHSKQERETIQIWIDEKKPNEKNQFKYQLKYQ